MTLTDIRRAHLDDAEQLAALGRRTFVETFVQGFGVPYPEDDLQVYLASSFALSKIRGQLERPEQAWWVAEQAGAIIAFANTGPCGLPHADARSSHAELYKLYVAREAQGIGLGTKLLELALDWMQTHTNGPLWIGVWSGNLKAQKLYAAHGFRKVGEYKYPVGKWLDDEHILRRD